MQSCNSRTPPRSHSVYKMSTLGNGAIAQFSHSE